MNAAADRAERKYGKELGPIVLEAALTMPLRKHGNDEHKDLAERLIKRLTLGETVNSADFRRLSDLRDLERRTRMFDYPRANESGGPGPVNGIDWLYEKGPQGPRGPAPPTPPSWWERTFGSGGAAPAAKPNAPTDARPTLPEAPAGARRTQRGSFNRQKQANPYDQYDDPPN